MSGVISSALRGGASRLATTMAPEGHRSSPPASFDTLLTWFAISTLAYVCFIRLPARLAPQYSLVTRSATSFNDFAWAAHSLHLCSTLWVVFDLVFRALCLLLLPLSSLRRLQYIYVAAAASPSSASSSGSQRSSVPVVFPDSIMTLLDGLRVTFTAGDSIFLTTTAASSPSFVASSSPLAASPSSADTMEGSLPPFVLSLRAVTCLTTALCLTAIVLCTWWTHTRKYLKGTLLEQNMTMTDPRTGDPMPLPKQYAVPVSAVPKTTWMLLWMVCVLSCFAWHRALPALTSVVFPAATCALLALDVLMP
ncbi:membrane-associated protein, putative [Bodo saltans]|uniref:Membrane-associated protein, putative n=1 Tax=Bodo saltans TaxID=75058 RepID=A0A0S4JCN9_BODSA|nr:membrane-associated protein, putative [Bodo saltans]|eukprot:CUG87996.1 membrane-associated protein, putative [Bodo saltans]